MRWDSDGYYIERVLVGKLYTSTDHRLVLITDSSDEPKNQFQKL